MSHDFTSSTTSVLSNASSSIPGGASHGPADSGEDLTQFVQAFKEMATNLDEEVCTHR